ncbi:MAG TPA: hypothetical protein PKA98_20575, partial [Acidimicrobiales bacterium]|nr:hypothetical protein [Acidimicrobiales bacterium]
LGFLFSTPAYRRTLELHGWEALGSQLRALARADRWADMAGAVSDDVLDTVVVSAPYDGLAAAVADRYADLVGGVLMQVPTDPDDDDAFAEAVADLRAR